MFRQNKDSVLLLVGLKNVIAAWYVGGGKPDT